MTNNPKAPLTMALLNEHFLTLGAVLTEDQVRAWTRRDEALVDLCTVLEERCNELAAVNPPLKSGGGSVTTLCIYCGASEELARDDPATAASALIEHHKVCPRGPGRDAARWAWWCKWWFDEKDDMEKINDLSYDDQASLNAAVDAEIASEGHKPGPSEPPRYTHLVSGEGVIFENKDAMPPAGPSDGSSAGSSGP